MEAENETLDLSGIERVIIAVNDLDHAISVYGDMFALSITGPIADAGRGIRSAICTPPTGGVIELVSVDDAQQPFARSIANFLDEGKEGMYALVLTTPDLESTSLALTARGAELHVAGDSADVREIETDFGVRLRIAKA